MSIVFDRAVEYYDKTRSLPDDRHRALIDTLIQTTNVQPTDAVLEIGIGTGRIAISVAQHVKRLYGIDLSQEMMNVLRKKLVDAHLNIDLSQADAVKLPFAANTFNLVYAVHVYHLVHNWRDGIADAFRVLEPGGHFVVNYHRRSPDSPNSQLRQQLHAAARDMGIDTRRPGAQTEAEVFQEISRHDPSPRTVLANQWRDVEVPEKILQELDRQIFSETWMIPRDVMDQAMPKVRAWAEQEFKDLSAPIERSYETQWLIAQKQ